MKVKQGLMTTQYRGIADLELELKARVASHARDMLRRLVSHGWSLGCLTADGAESRWERRLQVTLRLKKSSSGSSPQLPGCAESAANPVGYMRRAKDHALAQTGARTAGLMSLSSTMDGGVLLLVTVTGGDGYGETVFWDSLRRPLPDVYHALRAHSAGGRHKQRASSAAKCKSDAHRGPMPLRCRARAARALTPQRSGLAP